MGQDVHIHIEVKIHGVWHHYNTPAVDRWVALFDWLKKRCKHLPHYITPVTKLDLDLYDGDAHHIGWLESSELSELSGCYSGNLESRLGIGIGYLYGNSYREPIGSTRARLGLEDYRMIFWFDN